MKSTTGRVESLKSIIDRKKIKVTYLKEKNIMSDVIKVELVSGVSKKEGNKEWTAVKTTIGDFYTLYFPKSKFELEYIKKTIEENK